MRKTTVLALWRTRHRERWNAGHLRRHDIHDDRTRIDRTTAGHVQPNPIDREPALSDRATFDNHGGHVDSALILVNKTSPPDRFVERLADDRIKGSQGIIKSLLRHAQ